jgi:molecular chaperone GrpE
MTPEDLPNEKEEIKDIETKTKEFVADATIDSNSETTQMPEDAELPQDIEDNSNTAQVETLQIEISDLNDKLLRALAETENIRRRAERDKADATKYAITNFAREMLTISDTLQRALGSVEEDSRKEYAVIEQVFVGLEMNEREINNIFERFGIQVIKAMDEKFDHNFHEAMFEIDDPSKPAGTVIQVVETGYVIKDRLLRPAKVGVSKGGPAPDKDDMSVEPTQDVNSTENVSDQKKVYEESGGETGSQLDEEL